MLYDIIAKISNPITHYYIDIFKLPVPIYGNSINCSNTRTIKSKQSDRASVTTVRAKKKKIDITNYYTKIYKVAVVIYWNIIDRSDITIDSHAINILRLKKS